MGTYDVSLPADKKLVFPPTCVVCEKPNPDGEISLSILGANTQSLIVEVTDIALLGRTYGTNSSNAINGIPACKSCQSSLTWYHRIYKFFQYTGWIPAILLLFLVTTKMYIVIPVLLFGVIAPPILSMIFPPAFGATFLNNKANFEFKSQKIADEFKRLNGVVEG